MPGMTVRRREFRQVLVDLRQFAARVFFGKRTTDAMEGAGQLVQCRLQQPERIRQERLHRRRKQLTGSALKNARVPPANLLSRLRRATEDRCRRSFPATSR